MLSAQLSAAYGQGRHAEVGYNILVNFKAKSEVADLNVKRIPLHHVVTNEAVL